MINKRHIPKDKAFLLDKARYFTRSTVVLRSSNWSRRAYTVANSSQSNLSLKNAKQICF